MCVRMVLCRMLLCGLCIVITCFHWRCQPYGLYARSCYWLQSHIRTLVHTHRQSDWHTHMIQTNIRTSIHIVVAEMVFILNIFKTSLLLIVGKHHHTNRYQQKCLLQVFFIILHKRAGLYWVFFFSFLKSNCLIRLFWRVLTRYRWWNILPKAQIVWGYTCCRPFFVFARKSVYDLHSAVCEWHADLQLDVTGLTLWPMKNYQTVCPPNFSALDRAKI